MMKVIVSNQPGTTKGEIEILKVFAQIWGDMIWWQQCHCGGKASTTTRCVRLGYLLIVFLVFLNYISVFWTKCISRIWKIRGEVIWWQQCRSSHRYETCKSPLPALLKTLATSQYFWYQVVGRWWAMINREVAKPWTVEAPPKTVLLKTFATSQYFWYQGIQEWDLKKETDL